MKHLAFALFCCLAVSTAYGQLTPEQVAEKMRPEYRVDLSQSAAGTSSAQPALPALTRESVQREIAALEEQVLRIKAAIAGYKPLDGQAPDATLSKYQVALQQTQARLDEQRAVLKKLKS